MTITLRSILFALFSLAITLCCAQAPAVSYTTPQVYLAGNAVSLSPTSSGVAAPAYGSALTLGSGFSIPASVTSDAAGNVYVVDVGNNSVTKIPAGGGTAVTISGIQPTGIAVDATGKIYITDSEDGLVEVYSNTGTFIQTYSGFSTPVAVAVDNTGNIYVADNAGGIIREISNGNNQIVVDGLTSITGIAVDAEGNLYIADANYTLSKVAPNTDNKQTFGSGITSPIQGVAIDPSGNLFLAETSIIQKLTPAGGTAITIHSGYNNATGVAVGPEGNVYVADRHSTTIVGFKPAGGFYISAVPAGLTFNNTTGAITGTTTAASAAANYIVTAYNASGSAKATVNITVNALSISYTSPHVYSAGAPISLAPASSKVAAPAYSNNLTTITTFANHSTAVTTDPAGNFYYYDPDNQSIYKVALVGGTPVKVVSGYANVIGLAADGYGNIFMTQQSSSAITEVPADGSPAVNLGRDFIVDSSPTSIYVSANGTIYTIDSGSLETLYTTRSGAANTGNISATAGIAIDASGNVYIGETNSVVEILASGGSKVTVCSGFAPGGITIDGFGNMFITDITNNAIDEIPLGGTIKTVNYDITGSQIAADAAGNLFIGGSIDNTLKKLAPAGGYFCTPLPAGITISPSTGVISGTATVSTPATIYTITAYNNYGSKYTKVSLQFTPLTLSYSTPNTYNKGTAITPLTPTSNGVAAYGYASSEFYLGSGYGPEGQLALDAAGDIYTANGLVKKIPAGSNEGIPLGTGISEALGVAVDPANNVYVADYGNNRVVKILPDGSQQVLGLGFSQPYSIAVDSTGNVYVADYGNGVVKKMSSTGGVPTVVGTGISKPVTVAVDPAGNLYIGDSGLGYIVEVPANGGPQVNIGSGLRFGYIGADPMGNIFVSDGDNGNITEFPAGGGAAISLPYIAAEQGGIGIDGTGTIYRFNQTITVRKPVGGYFINQLPAGLTFNNTTGVLSGTPTAASPAKNYTITAWNSVGSNSTKVNIAVITNATLSALSLSTGTLTPAFAAGTASYSASVANSVSSIAVTPTATLSTSTIKVNGTAVKSGSASGTIALSVGSNTITVAVTAQDGITTQTYTVKVTRAVSSNAALSSISLSKGTLSPAFAATTTSYTDLVTNGTSSITLTPTTAEPTAKVTVNGTAVATGKASGAIALSVGSNTVTIIVTAPDGTTKDTYTVNVIRPSTNAKLSALAISAGTLTPVFNTNTTSYTASVGGGVSSITLTPTAAATGATIKVNGTTVTSGTASGAIALSVGSNTITTIVTAQDGVTTATYTLKVTRATASTNDNLASLVVSKGTLSPAFTTATTGYTDMVTNGTTSLTVTPTVADATATVTVNGVAVTSGKASAAIALTVGSNTINTVVTAQDGTTKKTYTIIVIRPSTNAKLSALTISSGTLTPAFNTNTVSYTDAVTNATASVTVTPTVTVTGATVKVNGTVVASGAPSGAIALAVGSNTITTVVTAQDGTTTDTYTVTVTRAPSSANIPDEAVSVQTPADKPLFDDDVLVVHQGVSPNGDGIDDFLQIDNISQFPDNNLKIMNRNGQLIYQAKGYDNATKVFDGHSNKNGQMQLPGTYFYSLDYAVKGIIKHKTGFLVLKY